MAASIARTASTLAFERAIRAAIRRSGSRSLTIDHPLSRWSCGGLGGGEFGMAANVMALQQISPRHFRAGHAGDFGRMVGFACPLGTGKPAGGLPLSDRLVCDAKARSHRLESNNFNGAS